METPGGARRNDQGLYNKPSAAVHPEALVAGTLPQYNTILLMRNYSFIQTVRYSYFGEMSLYGTDHALATRNIRNRTVKIFKHGHKVNITD